MSSYTPRTSTRKPNLFTVNGRRTVPRKAALEKALAKKEAKEARRRVTAPAIVAIDSETGNPPNPSNYDFVCAVSTPSKNESENEDVENEKEL